MSSGPRGQAPRRRAATCAEVSLFPRRKAGETAERMAKKGEGRPVHIHRKSIEALYGKPQAEAASDLGIALTTLKHLCRKMGIVRWPFQLRPRGAPARSGSAHTDTPADARRVGACRRACGSTARARRLLLRPRNDRLHGERGPDQLAPRFIVL